MCKIWVKTWSYNVENNEEYIFSRHLFFNWLVSLELVLGSTLVECISHWIKIKLDPYDTMWLNYKRLWTAGFNQRTTSIGESMHFSMKNGFDGVFASSAPHISASKMMDKAERKGNEIQKYNAQEFYKHRTMNNGLRGDYLTDYAYKSVEINLKLSKQCQAMKINNTEYHVYTPDVLSQNVKNKIIPRFYRLRKVQISEGGFLTCSCHYPSRMKMPCKHILAIVPSYTIEMFSCRWLIIYQHSFDRDGYSDFSDIFRRMEVEEFKRDITKGECIKCNNLETLHVTSQYPFPLPNTVENDIKIMSSMLVCERNKKLLVRGYTVKEQMSIEQNKEYNHDGSMNVSLSQESSNMFSNDATFMTKLQNEQKINISNSVVLNSNTVETCIKRVRECLSVLNDDKDLEREYLEKLNELNSKMVQNFASKKQKKVNTTDCIFRTLVNVTRSTIKGKGYKL